MAIFIMSYGLELKTKTKIKQSKIETLDMKFLTKLKKCLKYDKIKNEDTRKLQVLTRITDTMIIIYDARENIRIQSGNVNL